MSSTAKTIFITGATDGIGALTARLLTERGHRVLLHGRNR
ncbi:MAG: short-chain dehydrogenase, partial [Myxococcota bacterium]